MRNRLHARLLEEDEDELAAKLGKCGTPILLHCTSCGHQHATEQRCNLKWCPVCARKIAALRSLRYSRAVEQCKWPLFVTLTRTNTTDFSLAQMRDLRRAFGKLRHQQFWKQTVTGGVAAIEITNTGNGWHPHLHALLDCRWLSITVPEPRPRDSRDRKHKLCQRAAEELSTTWAKLVGQLLASVKIKRTTGETICKEVLKYAVKGSDLVESPAPIGDVLRAMGGTRLVTSFGSFYGSRLVKASEKRPPLPCPHCKETNVWMPDLALQSIVRSLPRRR